VIPIDDDGTRVYVPNYAARGNAVAVTTSLVAAAFPDSNAGATRSRNQMAALESETYQRFRGAGADDKHLFAGQHAVWEDNDSEQETMRTRQLSNLDRQYLRPGQRAIWRDETPRNNLLPMVAGLSNLTYGFGQSNPWVALTVGLAQGAILDQVFGVQLTANSDSTGQRATEDWRTWSNDRINMVFQSTLRNAQLYNRVAQGNSFGLPNNDAAWLFRQINGPLEMRLEDDLDNNFMGKTTKGAFEVLSTGTTHYSWGRAYSEWQTNGGDLRVITPTFIQLTPRAFEEGTVRNTDLTYPPGFIIDHEYGHVMSTNWNAPNQEPVGLAYTNMIGGDEALGENIPNTGARSYSYYPDSLPLDLPLIRHEYWADAIANAQLGNFSTQVGQPMRQLQVEAVLWSVIDRIITIQQNGDQDY